MSPKNTTHDILHNIPEQFMIYGVDFIETFYKLFLRKDDTSSQSIQKYIWPQSSALLLLGN